MLLLLLLLLLLCKYPPCILLRELTAAPWLNPPHSPCHIELILAEREASVAAEKEEGAKKLPLRMAARKLRHGTSAVTKA